MKITKKKLKRIAKQARIAENLQKLIKKGLLKNNRVVNKIDKLIKSTKGTMYLYVCTGQRVNEQLLQHKLDAIKSKILPEKRKELTFECMYPVYTAIRID